MANDLIKHKILKHLFSIEKIGEKNSGRGKLITELGRSLTLLELSGKIRVSNDKIDDLCGVLNNDGYIKYLIKDEDSKNHSYLITETGKKAFTDKEFLNNVWYRNKDFWFKALPILVATGTLIWTVTINYSLRKKLNDQELKIIELQNSLKEILKK